MLQKFALKERFIRALNEALELTPNRTKRGHTVFPTITFDNIVSRNKQTRNYKSAAQLGKTKLNWSTK